MGRLDQGSHTASGCHSRRGSGLRGGGREGGREKEIERGGEGKGVERKEGGERGGWGTSFA